MKQSANTSDFYYDLSDRLVKIVDSKGNIVKDSYDVGTIASYKDFTGLQNSIGSFIDRAYAVNGLVDEYVYSNTALVSVEISSIYTTQR
jgi:hypothetical protein